MKNQVIAIANYKKKMWSKIEINDEKSSYKKYEIESNLKNEIRSSDFLDEVRKITKKIEDNEIERSYALDWLFASMVIDRLFFYSFSIMIFILTFSILLTNPNFYNMK